MKILKFASILALIATTFAVNATQDPKTTITTHKSGVTSCSTHYDITLGEHIDFDILPTKLTNKNKSIEHRLVFILDSDEEFSDDSVIHLKADNEIIDTSFEPIDAHDKHKYVHEQTRIIALDKANFLKILRANKISYELDLYPGDDSQEKVVLGTIDNEDGTYFKKFMSDCKVK